ncbi:DUF927 domain-containing protein [Geoalkalibacter halelectricus]|uniref:DUF927 domain-containing protein n=1 Tax=Geoalkalibacter halelectricus TaxID=2847045 RepID=A0ABY5ZHB1_9BACT|nr:DUF927 domain-containing protein [Geoalkalibacter halelectricus]MDO3378117.1 DUF927 domain-containing protein [Geoalkalibacter halelectricus]UWZ77963.1 DUF927 domain-containing protein [Geoalkalibacter halelectricus]
MQTPPTYPSNFILEKDGLYVANKEGEMVRATRAPLCPKAMARTASGNDWLYIVAFKDRDGFQKEVQIPARDVMGRGTAAIELLVNAGLDICVRREGDVVDFIRSTQVSERRILVKATGWVEGRNLFVLPGRIIGNLSGERILFAAEENSPTVASMGAQGTLEEWKNNVPAQALGNPLLVFAISASFTGSLLHLLGLDGGVFHFWGTSSRGKTTLLMAAASVHGNGGDPASTRDSYVRNWNLTTNAIEGLGAAHNDGTLVMDEIGVFAGHDIDQIAYYLTAGQGRTSMTSSRRLRAQRSWRCSILSSGEISFASKAGASGRRVMAGQLARFVDVSITDNVFHDTKGLPPAEFVDGLKRACSTYYGTAGPAFLENLIEALEEYGLEGLRTLLTDYLNQYVDELTLPGLQPEEVRALRRFALVRVAAELAVDFGILPFSGEEILEAVIFARDAWLASNEVFSDIDRAVMALQTYIVHHHGSFPNTRNKQARVSNCKGFYNSEQKTYLFTDDQLKAATGGCEPMLVAKALRDRGLLVTHESGRLKIKQKLSSMDDTWVRFYTVRSKIVTIGDNETEGGGIEGQAPQAPESPLDQDE